MKGTIRWSLGIYVACIMILLAIYPQIDLIISKGGKWNGAFAIVQADEYYYAAYVNGLINGRSRKMDCLKGEDSVEELARLPETDRSIQIVPSYLIAIPARLLGLNGQQAFVLLPIFTALFAALAIFYLLVLIMEDSLWAAIGSLSILCLGNLSAGQGVFFTLLGLPVSILNQPLPFLRRYQPAVGFPIFFLLCAFIWQIIKSPDKKEYKIPLLAGGTLVALLYSYFYLWTTAIAWLGILVILAIISRIKIGILIKRLWVVGVMFILAMIPYGIMLSHRSKEVEQALILDFTHKFDLFRPPEILGVAVSLILIAAILRGKIAWQDPKVLFTASFALVPFIVFNQQVITGRCLQPEHYLIYIVNYTTSLSIVLLVNITYSNLFASFSTSIRAKRIIVMSCIIISCLGLMEVVNSTSMVREFYVAADDYTLVANRLKELSNDPNSVFLSTSSLLLSDVCSSVTKQHSLWSGYTPACACLPNDKLSERLYKMLYYSGTSPRAFKYLILEYLHYRFTLFGPQRAIPRLSCTSVAPITENEIEEKVKEYENYAKSFEYQQAAEPALSFVILRNDTYVNLANLDRWYDRDKGEKLGNFTIYQVKLKTKL